MNSHEKTLPLQSLEGTLLESPADSSSTRGSFPRRFGGWLSQLNWLFIFTVLLPTTFAVLYFGFVASDVFISDSSFVLQSVQDQAAMSSGIGSLLKSSISSTADEDTASVQEFIQSRDALRQLDKEIGVRSAFSSEKVDRISRFGGLVWWDQSFEALFHCYSKWIVDIEPSETASSITELEVRAFTPEKACLINKRLLEMSEKLVNTLNDRLQQDLVGFAEAEVTASEEKAEQAYVALALYRNKNSLVDPIQQSSMQLNLVMKMQGDLVDSRTQLEMLRRSASNNPQIPALEDHIRSLESEVAKAMSKATGDAASLTNKASEYERLTFERDFSEKQLGEALAFLERSRNEAQRKQLYLKRIVEPNTPDYALEPRRARNVVGVLVLGLVCWGIISLFTAGVREHQQ